MQHRRCPGTSMLAGRDGFTLIEMVIAIGIFAIISVVAFTTMNQFIQNRDRILASQKALGEIQSAFAMLERDVRFAVPRPVRDGIGELEGAFVISNNSPIVAGEKLRLTSSVPRPPNPPEGSLENDRADNRQNSKADKDAPEDLRSDQSLVRIAWRLVDGDIYRIQWAVLDRDGDSVEKRRRVLGDVSALEITAFSRNEDTGRLEDKSEWPLNDDVLARTLSTGTAKQLRGGTSIDGAPDGIEVVITLDNGRTYTRVLEIGASPLEWDAVAVRAVPYGSDPNAVNNQGLPVPSTNDDALEDAINDQINEDGGQNEGSSERGGTSFEQESRTAPGIGQGAGQGSGLGSDPADPNSPVYDPTLDPNYDPTTDPSNPNYDPSADPNYDPTLDPNYDPTLDPNYDPTLDPSYDPNYDPLLDPTNPNYDSTLDPNYNPGADPNYDPALDPASPDYDPSLDPASSRYEDSYLNPNDPNYDPTLDAGYDPTADPSSPEYDPTLDPLNLDQGDPNYDPFLDPNSPDYDPLLDPNSPEYDPTLDPTNPAFDDGSLPQGGN